jgi:protocatechuate 3,4-dioxygenase beta subunit
MRRTFGALAAACVAVVIVLSLQTCSTPPGPTVPPPAAPDATARAATPVRHSRERAGEVAGEASSPGESAPGAKPVAPAAAEPATAGDDAAKAPAAPLYAEVSGRVRLAARDEPVAGATVTLRGTNDGKSIPERIATTDARGEFRFAAVPPGAFVLGASKEGFAQRKAYGIDVTADRGRAGIELLLTTGGTIQGLVTDWRGTPAAGLHVRAERGNPNVPAGETTTGADGLYRFEHLLPEQYRVEVSRGGEQTQSGFVAVTDDAVARLDFRADASVAGVVLDAAGKPLAGAMITAWSAGPPIASHKTRSGADGRYSIPGLTPGDWAMQVQTFGDDGFAAPAGKLTVVPGENAFPIRVEAGEISGKVFARATGAALPPRELQLTVRPLDPKAGPFASAMAFAKKDGTFRFVGLGPGRYRLWAYPFDKSLKAIELDVDLAAGEHKEGVALAFDACRTGKIRIVARDAAGKPAEGLTVSVMTGDTATTGPTPSPEPGVYVLRLEVGSRTLELSRADVESSRVTAELKENETTTVEVTLAAKAAK